MGYYTDYELSVVGGDVTQEMIDALTEEAQELGYVTHTGGSIMEVNCKWYRHDEHMRSLSLAYPGTIFRLHGEGEESGDIWRAFYKDGNEVRQKAKLTFPSPPYNL